MNQPKNFHLHIAIVVGQFLGLLLLFSLTRFIFFLFNADSFPEAKAIHFLHGLRFDVSIILYINAIYFLFLLLPFRFTISHGARIFSFTYLVSVNATALALNLVDTCYYPFAMRRMTGDIFQFIEETNNMRELFPLFLHDYFYMFFIWGGLIFLLFMLGKTTWKIPYHPIPSNLKTWGSCIGLRIVVVSLMLTGMRGGWQYRPINIAAAGTLGGATNTALILNSPFTLLTTLSAQPLSTKHYFANDTLCEQYFTTTKTTGENSYFKPVATDHIVLIILEGISSEYSDFLAVEPKKTAGFTPFLDSLCAHSIVFKGMANGQQSIEALSSIIGGIPSLLSTPFSQSPYTANHIQYALPRLKAKGFHTSFFHGGKNGTMGFDRYCQLLGFDDYYGMNEYPHAERDFDGNWGIPDIPYLQYVADILHQHPEPYFATIFTLSSHHPFVVPQDYDNKVRKGQFPMQHTVAYTDLALREFFHKISKEEWYSKTLFVITADHTNFNGAEDIDYQKLRYAIPMIFYHPGADTAFVSDQIVQQSDIFPSIFSFCGWRDSFSSFGSNAFNLEEPRFAINYRSGCYEFFIDHYLIEYDGERIRFIWDLHAPAGERKVEPAQCQQLRQYECLLQSIIQQFNNKLIYNKL